MAIKLGDLIYCLKEKTIIEFDIIHHEKSCYFKGKVSEFLKSLHYHAFQSDYVHCFKISGNFWDGYVVHIQILVPTE